ncbi:hypothetical protein C9928_02235 [Pseudidiomarina aestuarii]|uniref:Uncharacterized protein n=1 Tax=Pseudidiomarina aestuarii TaxID=624146 RepID=A0A6N4DI59_9GAMM|nr:hypothetical protein C9928_02235 [Pseudidiomarina aestuarii]
MNSSIVKRLGAIALIIAGLLLAVLTPAGDDSGVWRNVGVGLLIAGTVWLIRQPSAPVDANAEREETKPITLAQSPILWLPIIIIVVALSAWLLN